jgi:O-antigen ligase
MDRGSPTSNPLEIGDRFPFSPAVPLPTAAISSGSMAAITSRSPSIPGGAEFFAGIVSALALGLLVAVSPRGALLVSGAVIGGLVYVWLAERIGFVLGLLLPVSLAALFVPVGPSEAAQGALLVAAVVFTASAFRRNEPVAWGAAAVLAIVGFWCLLLLNPNVPGLTTGLLGLRKMTFMFVGLAIGLVWPKGTVRDAEGLLVRMLCIAGIGVLIVHIFFPDIEASFVRGANIYSEEFMGTARVSGFLPGPFHASLLGAFLVLWAWHALLSKAESRLFIAVMALTGLWVLVLADVRTGYVTVALGIVLTLLLRPGARRSRLRTVGLTGLLVAAVVLLLSTSLVSNQAVSSIPNLGSDSRVASRVETIHVSEEMIGDSPLLGWGPGSAGSTLESAFFLRRHVTSHDQVLGFLVEGGIAGLLVVIGALWLALRYTKGLRSLTHPAAAAAIGLVGFGLAGDVSEALPISLFLMILIGLRARPSAPSLPHSSHA